MKRKKKETLPEKEYLTYFKKIDVSYHTTYNFLFNTLNIDNNDIITKISFVKLFLIKNKINNDIRYLFDLYEISLNTQNIDYILDYQQFLHLIKNYKNPIIPFWTDKIKNISDNIFLPNNENIELKNVNKTFCCNNKIFKTEHYKNKFENNCLLIEDNRNRKLIETNNKKNVRAIKVKLYLTSEQKNHMKRLFGVYRYYYNRAIQYINNYNKDLNCSSFLIDNNNIFSYVFIRLDGNEDIFSLNKMRIFLKNKVDKPEWLDFDVPSHLIDKALLEASQNFFKCVKMYKKNHKPFNLKFKNSKVSYETINIEKTMITSDKKTIFKNLLYNNKKIFEKINFSENIKGFNILDSSISRNTKLNIYYININYKNKEKIDKRILENKKICSIDPGLKTFLTVFSDNEVNKIGIDITETIKKVCKEIDILHSKINKKKEENKKEYKYNKNKRRNYKKAMHRKIDKLKNIKKELHNKSIKYLCDNYSKIITAPFEIQEMSQKFNSKISRNMYCLSYYSFLLKLKKRCERYDILLDIKNESYTSKTCTRCGNIKYNLGSSKIYKCDLCKISIDRDINGARNIMLKNNIW